jgi:cystathionine beta-lyase
MGKDNLQFNSKTIHGGQEPDKGYGAVMPPVYLTVHLCPKHTLEGIKGYEYSRTHNPTRTALEAALSSIEDGTHGFCFGSGMAAIDAVIKLLSPGRRGDFDQ